MKIKITNKHLIIFYLLFMMENAAFGKHDYTCDEIYTNYMNAVDQFLSLVESMDTGLKHKKDYPQYATALKNAVYTIKDQKDYAHPTLKFLYDAIDKSSPKPSNVDLNPLKSQMTSSDVSVTEWKSPNPNNHNRQPCKEKWGCDLGQKGTKCGK
ncbi:MAG: hypothetical protein JSR85_08135 [Proteobacteria bacterium]|nr:hypothetical protein [Pseudomonadota bacterium]